MILLILFVLFIGFALSLTQALGEAADNWEAAGRRKAIRQQRISGRPQRFRENLWDPIREPLTPSERARARRLFKP